MCDYDHDYCRSFEDPHEYEYELSSCSWDCGFESMWQQIGEELQQQQEGEELSQLLQEKLILQYSN